MSTLEPLEEAVLRALLDGDHPALVQLRAQLAVATVVKREGSGVGFFTTLSVPEDAPCSAVPRSAFRLGDIEGEIADLAHGAGFALLVEGGRLSQLEGFSYDETWPEVISSFALRYPDPARRSVLDHLGGTSA
jgi:hypothetical protein